jgi:hypothetical protein
MHFFFRNVNDAFQGLVRGIHNRDLPTVRTSSRAGDVLMVPEPVVVSYAYPRECVLLHPARDANPFFHLFEALWLLAGRNDVEPLRYYNSHIADVASDNGITFNGAYGYRWRHGVDQLDLIVDHLRSKPDSRRAVLQMWNVQDDLMNVSWTKDVCCNTHAYFALVNGKLEVTVCNRSNDLIWGLLGANAVQFAVLLEYVASRLNVPMGRYHQITNNLHVYLDNWKPKEWLDNDLTVYGSRPLAYGRDVSSDGVVLCWNVKLFDAEVRRFVDSIDGAPFKEPFLEHVARPMMAAFRKHKLRLYYGDNSALELMEQVTASDWRLAGKLWLQRRKERWEAQSRAPLTPTAALDG